MGKPQLIFFNSRRYCTQRGPMQVRVAGNRGTGCGQITVRRSVGSMWTRLPLGWFYLTTTPNLLQH